MTENSEPGENPLGARLRAWDPAAISEVQEFRGELRVVVPPQFLRHAAEYLRREPGLEFDFLSGISVVDRFPMEPRFELNYHLLSLANRQCICIQVLIHGGTHPLIDTVTTIWPTADWHEREIFDLFGVRFEGHPDLRRILLPDDWEGYPLRKDYPVEGFR